MASASGRSLRPPKRLETTREGRYFIAITIGVGLAAINTGNNLLYLVFGWLLSTIIASGVLSEMAMRGLRVVRRPPAAVHAGRPFAIDLEVTNTKRRRASYAISVADLEAGRPTDKAVFLLKIPAGGTARASYRHTLHRRGVTRFDGVRISTRFPFGLFTKRRGAALEGEVLVYPAIRPVTLPAPRGRRQGDAPAQKLGRRGEFFALREYREGDDRRAIHWRSSAKAGALLVRELEEESQRRAAIVLDHGLELGADEARARAVEEAIDLAASLAVGYLEAGYAVRVLARGAALGPFAGGGDRGPLLRGLALLPPAAPDAPFAATPSRGEDAVLVAPPGATSADWPADLERVRAA
jgi:uncharacterized protein (DUF58 family)